jgi:hypothetical protein
MLRGGSLHDSFRPGLSHVFKLLPDRTSCRAHNHVRWHLKSWEPSTLAQSELFFNPFAFLDLDFTLNLFECVSKNTANQLKSVNLNLFFNNPPSCSWSVTVNITFSWYVILYSLQSYVSFRYSVTYVINTTNLIYTSLSLSLHWSLNMFRALLAHHQETLHECSFGDYCVQL